MAASKQERIIPDELEGEIQRWFPPKSLARFQCVSKGWRSMILQQISNRNSEEEKFLIISKSSIQSIDFSEPEIKAVTLLEFPVEDNFCVGCDNGLVLYLDSENRALILFNPWTQTRQAIKMPYPNPFTPDSYIYGFGYDKSNDNYVFVIMDRENYNGFTWSSKTQNWVPFSGSLDPVVWKRCRFHYIGFCVNGFIYWDVMSGILCFDLKTCNFNVIEEPPRSSRARDLMLVVWGDRLAAVEFAFHRVERRCTHIWELDGQMQWMKIVTIPRFILSPDDAVPFQSVLKVDHTIIYLLMKPESRLKNGDLILVSKIFGSNSKKTMRLPTEKGPAQSKFYLYNEERKTFTTLKTQGTIDIPLSSRMIPYKNNLFSPVLKENGMGDINFKI